MSFRFRAGAYTRVTNITDKVLLENAAGVRSLQSRDVIPMLERWKTFLEPEVFANLYARELFVDQAVMSVRFLPYRLKQHVARGFLARHAAPTLPPELFNRVMCLIEDLQASELLICEAELKATPSELGVQDRSDPLICIPTCGHTDDMTAAISSLERASDSFGYSLDVIVADNSNVCYTGANTQRISTTKGELQLYYVGSRQRNEVISRFRRGSEERRGVEFAITPEGQHSYGASRNFLLLNSLGRRVINMDADVRIRGFSTSRHTGLRFVSSDPMQLSPAGTVFTEEELNATCDVIGLHMSLLGATLPNIVGSNTSRLESACPRVLASLQTRSGYVGYSLVGSTGDSGMWSTVPLMLQGNLKESVSWISDEETYVRQQVSRRIDRWFDASYIGQVGPHVGMCYGQDCRYPTLPFFPHYRNEDGNLAFLSRACIPAAFWAYLPICVQHEPLGRSGYPLAWPDAMSRMRLSDLIRRFLDVTTYDSVLLSDDPCSRLGQRFTDAATYSDQSLIALLNHLTDLELSCRFAAVELRCSAAASLCPSLVKDVAAFHQQCKLQMLQPQRFTPHDLPNRLSPSERLSLIRHYLREYGNLLTIWSVVTQEFHDAGSAFERARHC